MTAALTPEAAIALSHVTREYPNKPDQLLAGPQDARPPNGIRPSSAATTGIPAGTAPGCFARLSRRFPDAPWAVDVRILFDRQLTPAKVAGECATIAAPTARGFERPYGWAWLLKLADELAGTPWGAAHFNSALAALLAETAERWFGRFLPHLAEGRPETLFRPAAVPDRRDGKIAHLDGLNLSRAWCWRALAANDPWCGAMLPAAEAHLAASLPPLADDDMGAHWLGSFALLALEA